MVSVFLELCRFSSKSGVCFFPVPTIKVHHVNFLDGVRVNRANGHPIAFCVNTGNEEAVHTTDLAEEVLCCVCIEHIAAEVVISLHKCSRNWRSGSYCRKHTAYICTSIEWKCTYNTSVWLTSSILKSVDGTKNILICFLIQMLQLVTRDEGAQCYK